MVFAARAFICDPEWPRKAREGRNDEIRGCIGCVEGCFLGIARNGRMGCTCNPEIGREHVPLEPAAEKKRVLVVGGGPAGLQCALTASERGHEVTLLERSSTLGGHILMEAKLPGFSDRGELARWFTSQLEKNGVDVRLGTEATAESVLGFGADVVVIATGAEYDHSGINWRYTMPIEGLDTMEVLTPEDILVDGKEPGERVLVYDGTSYIHAPGIAEVLADAGHDVVLVSMDSCMANDLVPVGIHQLVAAHTLPKVEFIRDSIVTGVHGGDVELTSIMTYETSTVAGIDTMVVVGSRPPRDGLYNELAGKAGDVRIIGDADDSKYSAFGIDLAVKAGFAMGCEL